MKSSPFQFLNKFRLLEKSTLATRPFQQSGVFPRLEICPASPAPLPWAQLKPIIQIPPRKGRREAEKTEKFEVFQIFECVHISTPLLNRTRACPTIMATDHRPSLNIPSPGRRWFNPTMDRSDAGQCPGQMHYRRQTAAKRGWLQNRGGGMEPLALPSPPVESVGGALSRGHVTSPRFSFRREWPLFSLKFASILVESWSILSERGETTNDICRVTE